MNIVRGELQPARELGQQLLRLAQRGQDPALQLIAHTALGGVLFHRGDVVAARAQEEQSLALYDLRQHSALTFRYGEDPGVVCRFALAWILQLCGYPDQARIRVHEAMALARQLSHPFITASALCAAAVFYQLRQEGHLVQEHIETLDALINGQGLGYHAAYGSILLGWALAEQGRGEEGIARMQQGLDAFRTIGAHLWWPYVLGLLAEAYGNSGQVEKGLSIVAEALATVHRTGQRLYEAELYRLKGELSLQSGVRSPKSLAPSTQHLTP